MERPAQVARYRSGKPRYYLFTDNEAVGMEGQFASDSDFLFHDQRCWRSRNFTVGRRVMTPYCCLVGRNEGSWTDFSFQSSNMLAGTRWFRSQVFFFWGGGMVWMKVMKHVRTIDTIKRGTRNV